MLKINTIGEGKVVLIAGGGRIYTDIAARFVRSERELEEIVASPYDKKIVQTILKSGHLAATEFDWFIFGVDGYSRVTETQLVRKRLASYLIKSGRLELNGQRQFRAALPENVLNHTAKVFIHGDCPTVYHSISGYDILDIIRQWYNQGVEAGIPEEDLRYLKPQATVFKGIIGMNIHALRDWWRIRLCQNAAAEIRDMAWKMFELVKEVTPDLVEGAGPNCKVLGYCPENNRQNEKCKGKIPTQEEAIQIIKEHYHATE